MAHDDHIDTIAYPCIGTVARAAIEVLLSWISNPEQFDMDLPVRMAYADAPTGQIHYCYCQPRESITTARGSPRLPILLLHMSASSSRCFHKIMPHLAARGYTCYAPDMPGFGSSSDPDADPPGISWYADIYYRIFSGLPGFENGCHVIGHHSGAVIGTELAARGGAFCRSLTCIGPTIMTAADRRDMSKTFLEPFNKPSASGEHLIKTWDYLQWEGIPPDKIELLQREALDHIRAWKGRNQIYSCVWDYDCEDAMKQIPPGCRVMGLCAKDDILWPFFENFVALEGPSSSAHEIQGGNFGPDLDVAGIMEHFITLAEDSEATLAN